MIRDLLWGCVICRETESLRMVDRIETCSKCGARFRRADGADIAVEVDGRGVETRTGAEWTRQLPPITPAGSAECLVRVAVADMPVTGYREYLGRVEKFGNFKFGIVELNDSALIFHARDGKDGFEWPLGDITAIQPSSTSLQVKARGRPVASFKFVNSSSRLWEERLQLALRQHYSTRHITEFQPRVRFA